HYAISGEGEESMHELCLALTTTDSNRQMDIPGVSYLTDGNIVTAASRTKIKDIDALPLPARNRISMEHYLSFWEKHHGSRTLNISTQRGCPYTCKWCSTAVYGQSYRR